MNIVVLIGRLTRDPELSYTPNTQTAVCHFSLAVDRPRRNGEDTGVDYFRITVFGRQAENCDRYLAKGRQAAVTGRIVTGSYKNREGVTVNTVDIIASNVEFLGGSQSSGGQGGSFQGGGFNSRGRDNSYGGPQEQTFEEPQSSFGTPQRGNTQDTDFADFGELPDSFQAAEDDIPF
jgi:single-strand DNA-binding protein